MWVLRFRVGGVHPLEVVLPLPCDSATSATSGTGWGLPQVGERVGGRFLSPLSFLPVDTLKALTQGAFGVGLTEFESATP